MAHKVPPKSRSHKADNLRQPLREGPGGGHQTPIYVTQSCENPSCLWDMFGEKSYMRTILNDSPNMEAARLYKGNQNKKPRKKTS